jgi:hypothetical protein
MQRRIEAASRVQQPNRTTRHPNTEDVSFGAEFGWLLRIHHDVPATIRAYLNFTVNCTRGGGLRRAEGQ